VGQQRDQQMEEEEQSEEEEVEDTAEDTLCHPRARDHGFYRPRGPR
jgi:hypothetical protein